MNNFKEIGEAIKDGDIEAVKSFIESGGEINKL